MQTKFQLSIFALFLFCFACKKQEIPVPLAGGPIFAVQATFDNGPLSFAAGENNIYLYTDAGIINDSTQFASGHFAQANCKSCPNSLEFKIFGLDDTTLSPFGDINYDYYFNRGTDMDTLYNYTFSINPYQDLFTYQWSFNGVTSTNQNQPISSFSGFSPLQSVELTITDTITETMFSSFQDLSNLPFGCDFAPIQIELDPNSGAANTPYHFGFWNSAGLNTNQYEWNNGSNEPSILIDSPGTYCVTVTNVGGCSQVFCATLDLADIISYPVIPTFNFDFNTSSTSLQPRLYGAQIRYIDAMGDVWDSTLGDQKNSAQFLLSNGLSYEANELNNPTQQTDVAFNCILYKKNSADIISKPFSGTGKIALGKK